MMDKMFLCSEINFRRIWHCFGNYGHKASLPVIDELLTISQSNVLPINTHDLCSPPKLDDLKIGFEVSYPALAAYRNLDPLIKMLNINHQTRAANAFTKAVQAFELTGEHILKLEVLHPDLKTSNDSQVIEAVKMLHRWNPSLIIMPLISSNIETAKVLIDLGCPLLRVMGSEIGSGSGISHPEAFERICSLGVPVILDGGVGHRQHVEEAITLGASGVLINSMLFETNLSPVDVMKQFMLSCEHIFH